VPTVAFFYGIAIKMYLRDHQPPHFHATYGGAEAYFSIETGEVILGRLPRPATRMVKEWAVARRSELSENWARARQGLPLERIAGPDDE